MRQCDHPPCPTDGSVHIGDKIFCVFHAKRQSFPNVAQGRPATPRPKPATKKTFKKPEATEESDR